MAAFLWWISGNWADWSAMDVIERAWRLALAVGGGAAVYFAALALMGLRPRHLKSL
jgi:putative peptidoglycan lipid II flippase